MLIIAAVAWGIAALGALDLTTRRSDGVDLNAVLCIVVISSLLMALAHAIPDAAAIILACILAAHAALVATAIILDAFHHSPQATAKIPPPAHLHARPRPVLIGARGAGPDAVAE